MKVTKVTQKLQESVTFNALYFKELQRFLAMLQELRRKLTYRGLFFKNYFCRKKNIK